MSVQNGHESVVMCGELKSCNNNISTQAEEVSHILNITTSIHSPVLVDAFSQTVTKDYQPPGKHVEIHWRRSQSTSLHGCPEEELLSSAHSEIIHELRAPYSGKMLVQTTVSGDLSQFPGIAPTYRY